MVQGKQMPDELEWMERITLLDHEAFSYWLQQIAKRESMKVLKKRKSIVLPPEATASQEARVTPPD